MAFRSNPPGRSLAALCLRLAAGWWRSVLPLAAACAVLAAVIGGAFGVGDSITRNLEARGRNRLGAVSAAVTAGRFFGASMAARLGDAAGLPPERLIPAVVMPLAVETSGKDRLAARATLLAADGLERLGFPGGSPALAADAVAVSRGLARDLGASVGDPLVLRVLEKSAIPADSPLGSRTTGSRGKRVTIAAILPDRGIGGFSLQASQDEPAVVVAALATVASLSAMDGGVNAVLATEQAGDAAASIDLASKLADAVRPTLSDYGLTFEQVRPGLARLTSESLVIPPEADRAADVVLAALGGAPTMVLLANDIELVEGAEPAAPRVRVPYSTVVGIPAGPLPFGRLLATDGVPLTPPGPGEIIVDAWLADDFDRQGSRDGRGIRLREDSTVRLTFFEPETLHGRAVERSQTLAVSGVARMEEAAVERSMVPEVEGITDKRSIANWDPPFPFDASRVRTTPPNDEDDRYWKDHGATPKAFVSIDEARRMGAGRFGRTTAWHVGLESDAMLRDVGDRLAAAIRPAAMGYEVRPVLAESLAAARGSTPFAGLFLALSSFVMASALALEWLLARLLVATRLPALGTLGAIGWAPARMAALFGGVGAVAAAAGCLVGAVVGPLWTTLLLAVLERGFRGVEGAATPDFLIPAAPRPGLVAAVAAATFLVAAIAPWLAARRAAAVDVRRLLAGSEAANGPAGGRRPRGMVAGSLALAVAVGLAVVGGPPAQEAGRFFAAGGLALAGLIGIGRSMLRPSPVRSSAGLVRRGLVREPGRTVAVVGIVALAEFLIVAVSAFSMRPPRDPGDPAGPAGGWTLMASLVEPCAADLSDRSQLESLGLAPDEQDAVLACGIAPIRVSRGDDASCLNLQKVAVPSVLGVGRGFRDRGGFRFTASLAPKGTSPWRLLDRPREGRDGPIPVMVDEATARYALGLAGLGARMRLPDERGEPVEFEVVGLLEPGILQGALVASEEDFVAIYPSTSGSRLLLVDVPADGPSVEAATHGLRRALADYGAAVRTSSSRLAALGAVQNTYLAGFQALGAIGLVLGTAGVAAVQVRALLERSREFGLLSAIGFTGTRLAGLVATETVAMVAAGLAIGILAALVAVWPQLGDGRASPPVLWAAVTSAVTLLSAWTVGRLVVGRLAAFSPIEAMRAAE